MHVYAQSAAEAIVAALFVGVALYVLVTFWMAHGDGPKRSIFRIFFEMIREGSLSILIATLTPFYVAFGYKRGRGTRPIVVVHGYTQNRVDFIYLSRVMRRAGLGPIFGFNYYSFGDIRKSGDTLARFIERVCKETSASEVDLVCHSMGGLVARECIRHHPEAHVRRCVTIATPHAGIALFGPTIGRGARQLRAGGKFLMEMSAAPLTVPMLSIFSTHDNLVHPSATSSLEPWGGRDVVVDHVGHLSILFDGRVARAVTDFLQNEQRSVESIEAGTSTGPPAA